MNRGTPLPTTNAQRDLFITNARRFVQISLSLLIAWLLLVIISAAMSTSLEFDGAMNLLMSRSIAHGDGPRAAYDNRELFPDAVQTKAPFVLLGALIFKIFGVGQLQTQLPNLIYLGLLCTLLMVTMRRLFDATTFALTLAMVLASPWIVQYSLRGYGEFPTLFFGLAALSVVAWPKPCRSPALRRCCFAGLLVGLALATKVVGIVLVAMVGIVLLCRLFVERANGLRGIFQGCSSFAAGLTAPLLLVELWRYAWMGATAYRAWWARLWPDIMSQAGATAADSHVTISTEIADHFNILSTQVGLGHFAMVAAIVLPLIGLAFVYFFAYTHEQKIRSRWFLLGLTVLVVLYFPWWLAIVPTNKAWLRYIYIGIVSLEMIAAIGIVGNFHGVIASNKPFGRVMHLVLALAVAGNYIPLAKNALGYPVSFKPDPEVVRTREAARLIDRLPENAIIFGFGWYQAPSIEIYSHRHFEDLTNFPIGKLVGKPAYVVADRPTLITGILSRILARYPHHALMQPNRFAQVYFIDFANPADSFSASDQARAIPKVNFADRDYPWTEGMEPYNPIGGRFIESDSEILLRYDGQANFQLVGYMDAAQPSYYREPGPLDGRIIIDHCPALHFSFKTPGWRSFELPVRCDLPHGNVRIRILLDNVFSMPHQKVTQRAMLLSSIGFEK